MSTNAKNIVKKFYQTDFVTDAKSGISLLHDDIVLIWNSTEGLTIMDKKEIVKTFEEVSRTYEQLRIEVSHVLEDENFVTIRYKYYIKTIENPEEELGIAHFIAIWEIRDGKLYKGHQISQPVMSIDDSNGTYSKVKV
ncbi:nuclear transport factor 2 family protein [Flavobacteriaceae bacterium]|nr:nuclear transport factor 2 family protein [Flavobacteriaceae bacterium]